MKYAIAILTIVMLMPGCATIAHKDVSTKWTGFGANVEYESTVAIPPDLIPEFIDAVTRLENILNKLEQVK